MSQSVREKCSSPEVLITSDGAPASEGCGTDDEVEHSSSDGVAFFLIDKASWASG